MAIIFTAVCRKH